MADEGDPLRVIGVAEALCDAASSAPWLEKIEHNHRLVVGAADLTIAYDVLGKNADFIISARTGYPAALASLRIAFEVIEELGQLDIDGEPHIARRILKPLTDALDG